jgi:BlaI family penicillinase repressor
MSNERHLQLGRRERQIMDVIYRRGRASVTDVLADLPDPPTYSAVRGMLRLLEEKGFVRHEQEGLKYLYLPADDTRKVRASALEHMVKTFFGGRRSRRWPRCWKCRTTSSPRKTSSTFPN